MNRNTTPDAAVVRATDRLSGLLGEDLTRRVALRRLAGGGLGLALTAGGLRLRGAQAQEATPGTGGPSAVAASPAAAAAGSHRYKVGQLDLRVIDDGPFTLPGPFYGINAPPQEYSQVLSEAGHSMEALNTRSLILVVDTGDHLVLIDTGAKGFGPTAGQLVPRLQAEGIAPGDVDTVILTHLHLDHILGALDELGQPAFPNARYVINRPEYEFWWAEPTLDELPLPDDIKQLAREGPKGTLSALQGKLEQVEAGAEVVPGVKVIAAYGHTPGHLAVELNSGGETLLHIVDAAADPVIHLQHPDWFFISDNWPAQALATRWALLDRAAQERLLVQTYHFPFPGLGRVTADGDGWAWEPVA